MDISSKLPVIITFAALIFVLTLLLGITVRDVFLIDGPSEKRFLLRPLGKKRQRIAVLFLAIGIASFFAPLIKVQPAVMNRARWSPLETILAFYSGNLTHSTEDVFIAPAEAGGTYVVFGAAFAAALFRRSSNFVLMMASVAAVFCYDLWGSDGEFERFFFGDPRTLQDIIAWHTRSVDTSQLAIVLSLVCGVLAFICLHENMDDGPGAA